MTVLVTIPYWDCSGFVDLAVRSVLAQTHQDLQLLVVGDGEEPPVGHIRDSRLEVAVLPENRGPYFIEQAAILATPHDWYAQVAADDWLDPDYLATLVEYGTDVATGAVWYHSGGGTRILRKLYEVGLYRTARLRAIGGYNPGERIGQDSLTLHLLRITGGLLSTRRPKYHRRNRPDSLSRHPDTKRGSPARNEMRARNRAILAACRELGTAARIKAYRESLVPADVAAALDLQVELLSSRLGTRAAA